MDNRLVKVHDENEPPVVKQALRAARLDLLRLLQAHGKALRVVGHGYWRAVRVAITHVVLLVERPPAEGTQPAVLHAVVAALGDLEHRRHAVVHAVAAHEIARDKLPVERALESAVELLAHERRLFAVLLGGNAVRHAVPVLELDERLVLLHGGAQRRQKFHDLYGVEQRGRQRHFGRHHSG